MLGGVKDIGGLLLAEVLDKERSCFTEAVRVPKCGCTFIDRTIINGVVYHGILHSVCREI